MCNMKPRQYTLIGAGILWLGAAALEAGVSSPSNVASVTTPSALPTTPAAPGNLSATAVDATSVNLVWTDNANNEVGFQIERASAAGGPWAVVGTVGVNATGYTDGGLASGTTYYYRVSAYN
jgi:hypothetical protein